MNLYLVYFFICVPTSWNRFPVQCVQYSPSKSSTIATWLNTISAIFAHKSSTFVSLPYKTRQMSTVTVTKTNSIFYSLFDGAVTEKFMRTAMNVSVDLFLQEILKFAFNPSLQARIETREKNNTDNWAFVGFGYSIHFQNSPGGLTFFDEQLSSFLFFCSVFFRSLLHNIIRKHKNLIWNLLADVYMVSLPHMWMPVRKSGWLSVCYSVVCMSIVHANVVTKWNCT